MAEEQLQEADVRIKYFGATWCGPCKTFKPVIKKLEKAGYPIQIYDIDEDPVLAESYRIMSVPTLKIEVDGKVEETMVGIQDPDIEAIKLMDKTTRFYIPDIYPNHVIKGMLNNMGFANVSMLKPLQKFAKKFLAI